MARDVLLQYIRDAEKRGFGEQVILDKLLQSGYSEEAAKQALEEVALEKRADLDWAKEAKAAYAPQQARQEHPAAQASGAAKKKPSAPTKAAKPALAAESLPAKTVEAAKDVGPDVAAGGPATSDKAPVKQKITQAKTIQPAPAVKETAAAKAQAPGVKTAEAGAMKPAEVSSIRALEEENAKQHPQAIPAIPAFTPDTAKPASRGIDHRTLTLAVLGFFALASVITLIVLFASADRIGLFGPTVKQLGDYLDTPGKLDAQSITYSIMYIQKSGSSDKVRDMALAQAADISGLDERVRLYELYLLLNGQLKSGERLEVSKLSDADKLTIMTGVCHDFLKQELIKEVSFERSPTLGEYADVALFCGQKADAIDMPLYQDYLKRQDNGTIPENIKSYFASPANGTTP